MRKIIALWFTWAGLTSNAATYYFDFQSGSDANDGLSNTTPKQHHFYMPNYTGPAYTHTNGDHFIFKGGVTWPNSCFTMNILAGGSPGVQDYYGVDKGYFSGGSWSRPIFDAQGIELAGGYDVMVLCNLANAPHDIVFDNIDLRNVFWNGPKSFSQVAFFNLSVSSNITVATCWMHNWTHGPLSSGTTDIMKVVIGSNSSPFNPGSLVIDCLIDGENAMNSSNGTSSGEGTFAYSGDVINTTVRNCASGFIVTGDPANHTIPQIVRGCDIGPSLVSFDSGEHPDGLFMNGGNFFHWHDNYIHDCIGGEIVFAGNGSGNEDTYIWNNVIWNGNKAPIEIDTPYTGGRLYLWNNTLVGGPSYGVRVQTRGVGPLGTLDFRNNFVISNSGDVTIDPGAAITHYTNQNTVVMSVANASVNGFSAANRYQPTSASAATIGAGQPMGAPLADTLITSVLATNGTVVLPLGGGFNGASYASYSLANNHTLISSDVTTTKYAPFTIPANATTAYIAFQSNVLAEADTPFGGANLEVRRYTANATLPSTLTFLDTHTFGGFDSRFGGALLYLASGALIVAWHEQTSVLTNGTQNCFCGVSYLPAGSSTWIDHFPIAVPGTAGTPTAFDHLAAAQHPSDGSIWFFLKRDSYHTIDAFRCVESAGDVTISIFPSVISQAVNLTFGPDGELPWLTALPDPYANTIRLFYQRNLSQVFPSAGFLRGAYLGIASISTGGVASGFLSVDQYLERVSPYAAMITTNGIDVLYQTVSSSGVGPVLNLSTYNGSWSVAKLFSANTTRQLASVLGGPGLIYQDVDSSLWNLVTRDNPLARDVLLAHRPQGATWDSSAYEFLNPPAGNPGTVALSTSSASVSENGGFIGISVVRNGGTLGAVSVTASTADGTAVAGHDYISTSFLAQWADGVSGARSFTVPILASGDTALTNRVFTVNLSAATGGVIIGSPSTQTNTIVMNPPPPPPPTNGGTFTFTSSTYTTTETSGSVTLSVSRTGSTNIAATVNFATANGTATAGVDYTAATGTLSWNSNENTTKTLIVTILNSGATGPNRDFTASLSSPTGGAVLGSPSSASVSITLNAVVIPGMLSLSTSATTVPQSGGSVAVSVLRSGGTNGAVSVLASTANGSAAAGVDYTLTSFTANWPDGDSAPKTFSVPIINSGITVNSNRDFTVTLSGPTGGASLTAPTVETITILMPRPPTNAGTINMLETSHAVTLTSGTASISVIRSGSTNIGTSVSYTTVDGTAIAGTDYTATSGTLTWGINENSTKLISVPITNTGKHGSTPITFTVLISNPTNGATIGAAMTAISITLLPVLAAPTGLVITGNVDIQGPVVLKFKP